MAREKLVWLGVPLALRAEVEELKKELSAKNDTLSNLEKEKNDAEWSLGEHKQWLSDANERCFGEGEERRGMGPQRAQTELDGKNDLLGDLEKAKNDAEWNLGEHKQWLADANARYLCKRTPKLNIPRYLNGYQKTHYSALKAQLEEVQRELDGKNDILGNMEKVKNDAEWNLGEYKQWLADANEKYAHISVL
ncbi:unnamed protein product [Gongylonema pulchrum]|uniref:PH domain-containing protein n=1 Tax=Gongylonema pulchrum TaxID=637853 RepID=A0A183DXJ3_9BILA|nr:unnamed protein product [Gongylonema pulchrum]